MENDIVVGIDLGTTNSAIAFVNKNDRAELISNEFDKTTMPSIVQFPSPGEIVVGWEAKQQIPLYPDHTAQFFKREIGSQWAQSYHGQDWTPLTLSCEVLKKLKADAEAYLGQSVSKAVITVPAYFYDGQRRLTSQAAEMAGFEVLEILNEPLAAAFTFGLNRLTKPEKVLIYDLGGGTFDVTIADMTPGNITCLGHNGSSQLGGKDWDDLLMMAACGQFEEAHGSNPLADLSAFQELLMRVEELKKSLTSVGRASLVVNYEGNRERFEITKERFTELAAPLMAETHIVISQLLEDLNLQESQIDRVILAGGSTRMPMVAEQIENIFGTKPNSSINPDECVAQGAAIHAQSLVRDSSPKFIAPSAKKSSPGIMKISDVSAHSMGMVVISSDGTSFENNILLKKNTKIPAEVTEVKELQTSAGIDNTWDVFLLQGNSPIPTNNSVLGRFTFHGVPHYNGRTRVKVHYTYDQSTIGKVEGFDEKSGESLGQADFEPGPLDIDWTLEAPGKQMVQNMDVVFLVDTSGSMGGEIQGVKTSCEDFAHAIEKSGGNVRLGLVGFAIGAHGAEDNNTYTVQHLSRYTIGVYDLASPADFRRNIQDFRIGLFGGLGCYIADKNTVDIFPHILNLFEKSKTSAISKVFQRPKSESRQKILIIVSDEIGDTDGLREIVTMLKNAGVVTYVLGVAGADGAHERIAMETGGQFWDIQSSKGSQDFSGLLESVAQTIAQNLPQGLMK